MTEFTIVVPEGALSASVGATLDVLRFARQCAAPADTIRWQVLAARRRVALSGGMQIAATPLREARVPADAVLVFPGIGMDLPALGDCSLHDRHAEGRLLARMHMPDSRAHAALAMQHYAAGGRVAASCSGVLLLGMAKLLDGRRVTTHWRLGDFVRRHFPTARLDENRMLVEDSRVLSAGAAMAQADLMLHLVRQAAGAAVAEQVMRFLLLDSRATQARYRSWDAPAPPGDDTAARLEALVESRLPQVPTVAEAARELGLSAKTLSRHIAAATGATPLALIATVRMRHAQRLLAQGELSVEAVARRVGYANATALRKLTLKMTRLPPGMLRHGPDGDWPPVPQPRGR